MLLVPVSRSTTDFVSSTQSGLETPADALTDFAEIGQAREKMLSIKLEQQAGTDSVSGSTTIDPKGYLTGLESQVLKSSAEIGYVPSSPSPSASRTDLPAFRSDIKRARALLQSLIKTNPKHAPGWVAAAWLENVAGKSVQARKIIAEGCQHCSKNEDVWIAASELNVSLVESTLFRRVLTHFSFARRPTRTPRSSSPMPSRSYLSLYASG